MAWSFKKRKRIAPGVHLNFSKKGGSTSFGVKGFSITMGRRGTYLNTSIPGTGIYNRQKLSNGTQKTLVGSSAPDNTRKEQKNDEKDWLKIFLKVGK